MEAAFADPPADSAVAFRAIMEAMARPGTIRRLSAPAPAGLSPAAAAALLVLTDGTTPVWMAADGAGRARDWLTFHTGAPIAGARAESAFAVGAWADLIPLEGWPIGTPDYPDRSATLIVEMPTLEPPAPGPRLTGPGIETEATLPLPDARALMANAALYPLGLDLILTSGDRVAALPRSTRIEPGDA